MVCAAFRVASGHTSLGKNYGDPGLPNLQNIPLGFTNEIQRNACNTFGISSAAGAVDNIVKCDIKQLSELHSGFTVRVCSLISLAY